jgi:hypothetical protein
LALGGFLKGFSEIQDWRPSHFSSFTGIHFLYILHLVSALNFFNVVFASLELGKKCTRGDDGDGRYELRGVDREEGGDWCGGPGGWRYRSLNASRVMNASIDEAIKAI